jgi:DnaJ-class molecular chaperone
MTDYYNILGVEKTATADEIKKAYRKLASQHHPDKGGDTKKFQEIQEAYENLIDPNKRSMHDNPRPEFGDFNVNFNNLDDFFNIFRQAGFNPGHHPRRNHVRMSLVVSLRDVARGTTKSVNLSTSNGTNVVGIEVPPGINDGDNVQYAGIAPGNIDLVVHYRIQPDPKWHRQALNLYTEHTVSVWDLIVGSEIVVQNIFDQNLSITIPPKTQPGTLMKLRGQGLRDQRGVTGEMLVKLIPKIPTDINPELIEAIKKYR